MNGGATLKGTRGEIIALLRDQGEATVAGLSARLGIAPAALRRHLDILTGEGLIAHRTVKQATGRPYFAFRLTERAHEAAATGYPRLLERLVLELAALGPEETAAKDGRAVLDTVFLHMADQLADDYRDRVQSEDLEERVGLLTEALRGEGIVQRWEKREDGYALLTTSCPHRRAALATSALCASETRAIQSLLGAEVELVGRIVDGASCCEYRVRPGAPVTAGAETTTETPGGDAPRHGDEGMGTR